MIVGDIIEGRREPASQRWKPSGFRSSSPSMLFTWTPVPGTTRPEPVPFEQVTDAQHPPPSIAVMCVVEPSRLDTDRDGLGEHLGIQEARGEALFG